MDFAITMQSRWSTEDNFALRPAYKAKYDECINKAKILFPNDPMFQGLFEQHKKDSKKVSPMTKKLAIPFVLLLLFFIICSIIYYINK